ncbi:ankyrin repeat-containing domain protein [Xylaria sp. FL0043]|nr:ankyrin repeat-containing domain protein [Xylaria sp. FL0043]
MQASTDIGLLDLPIELLEIVFGYLIPEGWNRCDHTEECLDGCDHSQKYLKLRLVCRTFDSVFLRRALRKLDRDIICGRPAPLHDIGAKWLLAEELKANRRSPTALTAAVWNSVSAIILWKECNSEIYQEEDYFSAACNMLIASHGTREVPYLLYELRYGFRLSDPSDTEPSDDRDERLCTEKEWAIRSMTRFHSLHLAAYCGDTLIVETLLKRGIDPNLQNQCFGRPLYTAAYNGHTNIVRLLTEQGANLYDAGISGRALEAASHEGHIDTMQFLLNNCTSLHKDHLNMISSSFISAVKRGRTQAVKLLLAQGGIDVNVRGDRFGRSPLLLAARNGLSDVQRLLLERADVKADAQDDAGDTALLLASRRGAVDLARSLLSRPDVNPNLKNKKGDTPLTIATSFGQREIVRLLLSHPYTDPNLSNCTRSPPVKECTNYIFLNNTCPHVTPLYIAAMQGEMGILQLLLSRKDIDPDRGHDTKSTPLVVAIRARNKEMIQVLLDHHKTDPNQYSHVEGCGPLWIAIEQGNEDLVRQLLEHPRIHWCSTSSEGQPDGRYAIFQAQRARHEGIIRLLTEHPQFALADRMLLEKRRR